MSTTLETWMPEARQLASQCSCPEETARAIAAWMETAAFHCRNEDYYRGLVQRCGKAIGPEAYIADDGSKSEDVLCAKVPELVELHQKLYKDLTFYNGQLCAQINKLTARQEA